MQLKALITKPEINLEKGKLYEIADGEEIVQNCWKILIPMKQKGKFKYALVRDSEGVLV